MSMRKRQEVQTLLRKIVRHTGTAKNTLQIEEKGIE